MASVRAHLRIRGRVQGVGFRAYAQDEALALGLTGWVRNRADGTVEAVAEGEETRVERFVTWCHAGPPGAHVTDVEVDHSVPTGDFQTFSVSR